MVAIRSLVWTEKFERELKKTKDRDLKNRVRKQIEKILENPEAGKPLRFQLKGEHSVYVPPYRIIYAVEDDTLYLLRFEHRKTVHG